MSGGVEREVGVVDGLHENVISCISLLSFTLWRRRDLAGAEGKKNSGQVPFQVELNRVSQFRSSAAGINM